jgi:hypothetical protein
MLVQMPLYLHFLVLKIMARHLDLMVGHPHLVVMALHLDLMVDHPHLVVMALHLDLMVDHPHLVVMVLHLVPMVGHPHLVVMVLHLVPQVGHLLHFLKDLLHHQEDPHLLEVHLHLQEVLLLQNLQKILLQVYLHQNYLHLEILLVPVVLVLPVEGLVPSEELELRQALGVIH